MKVFIDNLETSLGKALVAKIQSHGHEVVGSVHEAKLIPKLTTQLLAQAANDTATASIKKPVVLHSQEVERNQLILQADAVIVCMQEHPKHALELLQALDTFDHEEEGREKTFVALSTVLTWGKTPQPVANEEEVFAGFKEDDYKGRKTGRMHAEHKAVETQILSAARPGLHTLVVASGLMYGGAHSHLEYLLREAWLLNAPSLPVPVLGKGDGSNFVPTISIYDLASFVVHLLENAPSKQYVVAVDKGQCTLAQITEAISTQLGTGSVGKLTPEQSQALMLDEASVAALQLDLRFDVSEDSAIFLAQSESEGELTFEYFDGFLANITAVVKDYLTCMNLKPLRVVTLGPPQVGKSTISRDLAKQYYVPLITPRTAILDVFHHLVESEESRLRLSPTEKWLVEALTPYQDDPSQVPDDWVRRAMQWKLSRPSSRNQGYVLDGYPTSYQEAELLFEVPTATEGEGEGEGGEDINETTGDGDVESDEQKNRLLGAKMSAFLPTHVIVLNAEDDFIAARAQALSEEDALASGNTEEAFQEKLQLFKEQFDPANTKNLPSFFEMRAKLEVLEIDVTEENQKEELRRSIQRYLESGGKPYNFHPTKEELLQIEKEDMKRRAQEEADDEARQQKLREEELMDTSHQHDVERIRLEQVHMEEMALLEARSMPLRNYLMETVIPALTEGMLEVVKLQPEDPIDFLAEFLFQKGQEMEEIQQRLQ